ncbi:four helix bundle protein [Mucilaginibacter jinjuensis]|uniref:Four helix bundle protein n=1 Tax=Mucilaginibacter jinjuensis TaxID=1176721 RepID=A0ABY7T1I0_9SPHI|nr:four helix bundle protein [Mucilaginibacter jinjuensis]WCT10181.1 four helix bundle protein [Mucilaginibacter jinjuensis]
MASFTDLDVWKKAREIRIYISELVKSFPKEEIFRLSDQIIRSFRSIGNNLAEGHGRYNYQDNIRFCVMARGSLSETLDHMLIALDENIIAIEVLESFQIEHDNCLKLINGYIQYLKKKKSEMGA